GQKVFEWDQTLDEVNIYINLPPKVNSKQFYCKIQSKHIELGIKGNPPFLNHDLTSPVKTDSSFWTLEDDIMHITLNKRDKGQTWASPILGQGQLDAYSTDLEQKRLMLQRFQEEIGYAIAANYWGQGICTKAVKVAVSQVFKDIPDLVRLQAFVSVENQASQRVLEKVGFLREGILRKFSYVKGRVKDVALFSLLSGDTHSLQTQVLIFHKLNLVETVPIQGPLWVESDQIDLCHRSFYLPTVR
ncbi:nudC domain-containing protein 2-like, partial [Trifolium pratense]